MSQHKTLTISVAAYNVEDCLARALESCLIPNLDQLEVIVVDDGSRDGTGAIADEYAERYPDSFRVIHKANGGYGSTINASVVEAEGRYYKLLDADDWFDLDNLSRLVAELATTDEDVVATPYQRVFMDDGHVVLQPMCGSIMEGSYEISALTNHLILGGMHGFAFKTDNVRDVRITEHCFYTDREYVVKCMAHSSTIRLLEYPVYQYCIGRSEQSTNLEGVRRHYEDTLRVTDAMLAEYARAYDEELPTRELIRLSAVDFLVLTYESLFVVTPCELSRRAVAGFDRALRGLPDLYQLAGEKRKNIRLYRITPPFLYRLFWHVAVRRFVKV